MPGVQVSVKSNNVPTFISLADASRKFGLPKKVLTEQIQAGKIEAVRLATGELLVADKLKGYQHKTKDQIIAEKYSHLRGKVISASGASRKYSTIHEVAITPQHFSQWAAAGHIAVSGGGGKGNPLQLDEADVAYCADIYAQKVEEYGSNRMVGVRIFDLDGNPYLLKYPEVAKKLRNERHLAKQLAD
jgi:hypothetical protein